LAPTVGIAATGFCYLGGILQVFIDEISKFFDCQQQQAAARLLQQIHQPSSIARLHLVYSSSTARSSSSSTNHDSRITFAGIILAGSQ
jgi:hypothetical protein